MIKDILLVIIPLAGTLIGSISGIMTATRMTTYRIDQLEKKVDKHNAVQDRVTILEQSDKAQWKRVDEIKEDVEKIKKEVYTKEGSKS